jgi:hypothetical protein
MSGSEAELRAQLAQVLAERLDSGGSIQSRCDRLEDVVRHADAAGYRALAFAARRHLGDAYRAAGRWDLIFTVFARCLADYDASPDLYAPGAGLALGNWYLSVVSGMAEFPDITLAQIETALGEIERRYGASGEIMQEVHDSRRYLAQIRGAWDDEERHHRGWLAAGGSRTPDDMWGLFSAIRRQVLRGDPGSVARALSMARPALTGQLALDESPAPIQCLMLIPLATSGAWNDAVAAFGPARRTIQNGLYRFEFTGMLVEFCALTGNERLGLKIVKQSLHGLPGLRRPFGQMQFSTSAALLFGRLVELGLGGEMVRANGGDDALPASTWYQQLRDQALDLAARFDARNGTTAQGDQVRARLAARPLIDFIPLEPTARPWRPPAPIPLGLTAEQILHAAEWYALREDRVEARRHLAALGDLPPGPLAHWAAALRAVLDDSLSPVEREARAEQCFRSAGDVARQLRHEATRLALQAWDGDSKNAVWDLTKTYEAAFRLAVPRLLSHVEFENGGALMAAGRRKAALRALTHAADLARRSGDLLELGQALFREAWYRGGQQPDDRYLAALKAAKDALIAASAPAIVEDLYVELWRAARTCGAEDWFRQEVQRDLAQLPPGAPERLSSPLRWWRGTCLVRAGHAARALPDLLDAAGEMRARGLDTYNMAALLGISLRAAGRFEDAVIELYEVCDDLAQPERRRTLAYPELAELARRALAESYQATGRPGAALTEWDRLAEQAAERALERGAEQGADQVEALTAQAAAARLVHGLGHPAEAARRYAAAAEHAGRLGRTDLAARLRAAEAACRQEAPAGSAVGPP